MSTGQKNTGTFQKTIGSNQDLNLQTLGLKFQVLSTDPPCPARRLKNDFLLAPSTFRTAAVANAANSRFKYPLCADNFSSYFLIVYGTTTSFFLKRLRNTNLCTT